MQMSTVKDNYHSLSVNASIVTINFKLRIWQLRTLTKCNRKWLLQDSIMLLFWHDQFFYNCSKLGHVHFWHMLELGIFYRPNAPHVKCPYNSVKELKDSLEYYRSCKINNTSWATSYMLQNTRSQLERRVHTLLEQPDKTLTMKLVNFLQIRKDNILLSTQRLWQWGAIHLRNVVINNILQRANIIMLGVDKFLHYQQLSSAKSHKSLINW